MSVCIYVIHTYVLIDPLHYITKYMHTKHTWIEARLRFHVIFKGNVPFYDSQIQNVNIESKLELSGNDKFD